MSAKPTIKMLTSMAGVDFSVSPNEQTDRFSENEARRMVAAGMAEPTPETAEAWAKVDAASTKPARPAKPTAPKA